jgi:hypothetical protein
MRSTSHTNLVSEMPGSEVSPAATVGDTEVRDLPPTVVQTSEMADLKQMMMDFHRQMV